MCDVLLPHPGRESAVRDLLTLFLFTDEYMEQHLPFLWEDPRFDDGFEDDDSVPSFSGKDSDDDDEEEKSIR